MTAQRVLILANEMVSERATRGVPKYVRDQVLGAEEVRVVTSMLTTRLESWASDTDAAASSASDRMRAIVSRIETAGQHTIQGTVGDEDPLQAIADALAPFPADALILATHTGEARHRRERRLREKARTRFDLPTTEMLIDGAGSVVSVRADQHV